MSSNAEEAQNTALLEIKARAESIRRERLEAAGLAEQYDLWRESMPNTRMPDNEVYNLFMDSQVGEEAANLGRLSVTTGGEERTLDTEIPTPGPDGDGTRPDEAGEDAEGGEDRDTELKIVPGMWTPPPEAEAENYEEPSTYNMTQSEEFIKNAKVLYEYMDRPGDTKPRKDVSYWGGVETTSEAKQLNDSEIGEWARNIMSGFNWNVVNTMAMAQRIMTSEDPELALAFLNMSNMYDHSDGSSLDFAGALGEIATDPASYLGLGVGSVVAKGAAKAIAKTALKKAIQGAIIGGTAGAIEGGMLAGGFDLTKQNVEQEAGARQDIDYGRAGIATGLGVGLGLLLGTAGGGWAGRKMDTFAQAMAEDKAVMKARDVFLDERAMKEIGVEELGEILGGFVGPEGKAQAKAIFAETGSAPRLEDGSIDYTKIYKIMDDVSIAHTAAKASGVDTVKTPEQLEIYVDQLSVHDNRWVMEKDNVITYFDQNGDYGRLEALADVMGISYHITEGENKIFALGGGSPAKKADFLHKATGMRPPTTSPSLIAAKLSKNEVRFADDIEDPRYQAEVESLAEEMDIEIMDILGEEGEMVYQFANEQDAKAFAARWDEIATGKRDEFLPDVSDPESMKLVAKVMEMQELEKGEIVLKTPGRPGSKIKDKTGEELEIVGRTKNGWYRARDRLGRERSLRRKDFDITEKAPAPQKAGPMELNPFSKTAAKIIEMNEEALSGRLQLREVRSTHPEQAAQVREMERMGIDITKKPINAYWTPSELRFLRDTYNKQARGMADLARILDSKLRNENRISDPDLARFNNAHAIFVATRDLFYGVSGNAARQLNTLRSKPTEGVYDFGQAMMDSISLQGGRANTERAITMMAQFASKRHTKGDLDLGLGQMVTKMSKNVWGNPKYAAMLNIRYNMMLSSWRTHAFNLMGNTISGLYMHFAVSPVRMGINNLNYMRQYALGKLTGKMPDPADRMTAHMYGAELMGHRAAFVDSLHLAKEIALGHDIGEGKIWNELGLRYNVINVPNTKLGKIGTTPVRMLEAGDAFFKNQYYMSKMHELSSIKARYEEIHEGRNYQKRYAHYLSNLDELGSAAERTAKDYAAKQTYTNDPSVYGGIFTAVAEGVSKMQNQHVAINMIVPFVRTPANLLQYSMQMIGADVLPLMGVSKTYEAIFKGTQRESQEALARLTVAAGLWLTVQHYHEEGLISGTGPGNWEERQVWIAAGWQPNSVKLGDLWWSIERAAPGGQALATIASIFDWYAMTQQQDKPLGEWVGAGLLYTADAVLDESYLSTATDVLTAISSKEQGRFQSTLASMINSVLVPNLVRDLRRPADPTSRTTSDPNLLGQVWKQMQNAYPVSSANLAPNRDWKGDPKDNYGSAFWRSIVPFNVRDSKDTDMGSMAIAYARIPINKPNASIDWPGGLNDGIDLYYMDNGKGFVYDEYIRRTGVMRNRAVTELLNTKFWAGLVEDGDIGPGSNGDRALREAISLGSTFGRLDMLQFLIEHSDDNDIYYRIGPGGKKLPYVIQHAVSPDEYVDLQFAIREEGYELTDEEKQYIIQKPVEGPQFFKPNQ